MPDELVEVISGFGLRRGPFVTVKYGDREIQMSVEEARNHALNLIQCCEAAEMDGIVFEWVTVDVKQSIEAAGSLLLEFRKFRDASRRRRQGVI
jgi:hypothetical protein